MSTLQRLRCLLKWQYIAFILQNHSSSYEQDEMRPHCSTSNTRKTFQILGKFENLLRLKSTFFSISPDEMRCHCSTSNTSKTFQILGKFENLLRLKSTFFSISPEPIYCWCLALQAKYWTKHEN